MMAMIRLAEEKDAQELLRLLDQVNNVHAAGRPDIFVMNARKYDEKSALKLIEDPSVPIFVYPADESSNCDDSCRCSNSKLCGYAICNLREPAPSNNLVPHKVLYIDDICVDEACRRQGVGTKLYQHVRAFAKEAGCYHITLNVWTLNGPARAFYEGLGMKPLKTEMEDVL